MIGQKTMPSMDISRGGVEVVVEELAPRLVSLGQNVTCLNRKGCYNGNRKEYKGVRLIDVPCIRKRGLSAATSSILASFRAAFGKYDIVHYHAEGTCVFLWLPKLMRKRCIVTIHGIDWQRDKWKSGFGSRYIRLGEKTAVRYADEIIVLSHNAEKYFLDSYGRKTVYIPNGVPTPTRRNPEIIQEKFGLEKEEYILFLGRLVPEKGLEILIRAFRKLKTDRKLVIAGYASDTDEFVEHLEEMARGDERIRFVGFVQGKPLEELYSNAYFYVLPSFLEGMPISLLEAMSYGNCCHASDIPECSEAAGEHAVYFHCGDEKELMQVMQRLLDDPSEVRYYREGAADYILSRYNWDSVAEKTLALYRESEGCK